MFGQCGVLDYPFHLSSEMTWLTMRHFPNIFGQQPSRMSASLWHVSTFASLLTDGLVITVGDSYIWTHESDSRLIPSRTASRDLRAFEYAGHKSNNLGTSFTPDPERIYPVSIV